MKLIQNKLSSIDEYLHINIRIIHICNSWDRDSIDLFGQMELGCISTISKFN